MRRILIAGRKRAAKDSEGCAMSSNLAHIGTHILKVPTGAWIPWCLCGIEAPGRGSLQACCEAGALSPSAGEIGQVSLGALAENLVKIHKA